MSSERLLNALGKVDEELIIEAAPENAPKKAKKYSWIKWGALAACACLVVGIGAIAISGGDLTAPDGGANAGGGGEEPGTIFMSYTGPIFPLNAISDADGIVVERNIDFDFSPYETKTQTHEIYGEEKDYEYYSSQSIVTDDYILKNSTDGDIIISAVYPFVANFSSGYKYMPSIAANGNEIETQLYAGRFSGSFYSASGFNTEKTDRSNIASLDEWTDFQSLLENGDYLEDALADYPELNQKVIVYRLSNIDYSGTDENATSPTLCLKFNADYNNTTVLSYGSTGGRRNRETGVYQQSYHIPKENERDYKKDRALIIIGDDISNLTLLGYRDGGCDEGEEIEGVTADLTRYETTLGDVVWEFLIEDREPSYFDEEQHIDIASDEMLFGSIAELMLDYGILSDDVAERYAWGALSDMWSETYNMQRVMYVAFEITVPANSNIQITATMLKDGSMDFVGEGTDRNGYDMVTTLGSSLEFTNQSASISNSEYIEIIYQNFGFDLENGITKVELNMNEPHYYMEVRKIVDDSESD